MRIVEPLLGTRAEIAVEAESNTDLSLVTSTFEQAVIAEAERLEALFTVFDPASALHAYRRDGFTTVPELRTVIELARRWQDRTGGAFHPAVQPLVDLWDEASTADVVPTPEELATAAAAVQTGDPAPAINLNAIAKGWIAGRALDHGFQEEPRASAAWLSIGGDVVHRGVGSVVVGVENPHRPYDNVAPVATAELSNEALATSGGARRWWRIGGRRYPKVLDPRTGRPVDHMAGATVIAADGATADVLATAAIVLSPDETISMVEAAGGACYLIDQHGSVTTYGDRFIPV